MSRKAASLWVIVGCIVFGTSVGAGFESLFGGSLAFAGFFAGLGLALILNAFLTVDTDVYGVIGSELRRPHATPDEPAPPRRH
jgi:hypothetical protein